MNEKLKIQPRCFESNRVAYLKESKPFFENTRAVLIHRPKSVEWFKLSNNQPHMGIHAYCGNVFVGSNKFTFLDSVPDGRIVCARCELAAIESGLKSSSELSGKHVCIGGVKAFSLCCP